MNDAIVLAINHGAVVAGGNSWIMLDKGIEAFYHAARAEALREAIAEWERPYSSGQDSFINRLRAMAYFNESSAA